MKRSILKLDGGNKIYFRKGVGEPSSDEQAIEEVIMKKAYRRLRDGFDVMPGERWLDLGANIGAFAKYVQMRGAVAVCYEPEPGCFKLLQMNTGIGFASFQEAVTASKEPTLQFRKSKNPQNNYRGTVLPVDGYIELPPVVNCYAGQFTKLRFDGVKMDIEGAEGWIIDDWLLPRCSKLVLEYHTSRDSSVENLRRRINKIAEHFKQLRYPKDYDRVINLGQKEYRPRFDQLVFAWEPK